MEGAMVCLELGVLCTDVGLKIIAGSLYTLIPGFLEYSNYTGHLKILWYAVQNAGKLWLTSCLYVHYDFTIRLTSSASLYYLSGLFHRSAEKSGILGKIPSTCSTCSLEAKLYDRSRSHFDGRIIPSNEPLALVFEGQPVRNGVDTRRLLDVGRGNEAERIILWTGNN